MRREEMDQTKRHHSESHRSGRRDQENRHAILSEVRVLKNKHSHQVTHTHHKHSRSDHHAEKNEYSKRQKNDGELIDSQRRPKDKNDRAGHRNSPIELVYSGCRNTDSSSTGSSEETDGQNDGTKRGQSQKESSKKDHGFNDNSKKNENPNDSSKKGESSNHSSKKEDGQMHNSKKKDHLQNRKRNRHEESFKELSDRKKQIELELKALDAEEAAQAQRKKAKRNPSNQHQEMESRLQVRSVHIKRELLSDDEDHRRKKTHSSKRSIHIKREPVSDDDRGNRKSQTDQRRTHSSSRIKPELDSPRPQRLPSSSNNRRRRNAPGRSDEGHMEWGRPDQEQPEKKETKEKEKPDFNPSGRLAEDTNTFNGIVIKYNEPAEARKPRRRWRLYPFKGDISLPFLPVHRQSAYLLGRSRIIADIPIDHPSCSKQHAVLQFRLAPYTREDGTKGRSVRPYVIDLDSSNGTFVNNKKVDPRRYMELFEKDVLKFGFSSRVYVILHEDSKNEDENDDDEEEN